MLVPGPPALHEARKFLRFDACALRLFPLSLPSRWITWYTITMAVIVPVVLAMGAVHKWRLGLVFLLVPLTYMLMQTT